MSQTTDYTLKANLSGTAFRTNLNEKLAALLTQNSGQTEPNNPVLGMFWLDTSDINTYYLKLRNETSWSVIFSLDVATGEIINSYTKEQIDIFLNDKISMQDKSQANGVASLDENGKIPILQIPDEIPNALKLNNYPLSSENSANTVVMRNINADINARLFKSSFSPNQATATASISFRENETDNNYIRFMTPAMFKTYLQNIGVAITDTQREITDSVSTTSSTISASATAVKTAYDLANRVNNNTIYKAGSNVEAQVLGATTTRNRTMTKAREITLPRSGVVTVTFTLTGNWETTQSGDISNTHFIEGKAQIYVNNVARGTLRSSSYTQRTNLTFSENITVNALDKIQLYIASNSQNSSYRCQVSNFKITVDNPTAPFIL